MRSPRATICYTCNFGSVGGHQASINAPARQRSTTIMRIGVKTPHSFWRPVLVLALPPPTQLRTGRRGHLAFCVRRLSGTSADVPTTSTSRAAVYLRDPQTCGADHAAKLLGTLTSGETMAFRCSMGFVSWVPVTCGCSGVSGSGSALQDLSPLVTFCPREPAFPSPCSSVASTRGVGARPPHD